MCRTSRCGLVLLTATLGFGATPVAWASPGDIFGFGAGEIGRGGGGYALLPDGGAAFSNPAGVAARDTGVVELSYTAMRYNLALPPPVYWDTNQDGLITQDDAPLRLDQPYDSGDGLMLGLAQPVGERLGLGVSFFYPFGSLLRIDTFEPLIPTYFMHRSRSHRYAFALAGSAEPINGLQLGAGVRVVSQSVLLVHLTVDGTASGEADESSDLEDLADAQIRVHSIRLDLVPKAVPTLGARWELGAVAPGLEGLVMAAGWRGSSGLPVDVEYDMQFNLRAEDVGELDPVSAAVLANGLFRIFDHYIPHEFQGGLSYSFLDRFELYGDLRYTLWSAMRLNVTTMGRSEFTATLADTQDLELEDLADLSQVSLQDTMAFRVGGSAAFPDLPLPGRFGPGEITVRAGGGLEPTPLAAQGPDTALLDSDRLVLAAGLGLSHGPLREDVDARMAWDAFYQLQLLAPGQLERPATDGPQPGYPVDDAPIPIGGSLFSAGLQWSLEY